MKSNAAASQSSGRRGILRSLLLLPSLLLVLMLLLSYVEQTERAQALMKMRLPNAWLNLGARKTKSIRTPRAFCFNHPERKLRQLFLHISGAKSGKIEIHDAFRLSCELFRHQRPPPGYCFPIDVTLRFAVDVGAHSRKIVAFSKLRQWSAVAPKYET